MAVSFSVRSLYIKILALGLIQVVLITAVVGLWGYGFYGAIQQGTISQGILWGSTLTLGGLVALSLWLMVMVARSLGALTPSSQNQGAGSPLEVSFLASPAPQLTAPTVGSPQPSPTETHSILQTVPACITRFKFYGDNAIVCDYISPKSEDLFGYPNHVLMENPYIWLDSINREDFKQFMVPAFEAIKKTQKPLTQNLRYRFHHRDDSIRWVLSYCSTCWNDQGYWDATVVATDITELEETKIKLQCQEELFQSLFDQSLWGVLFTNFDPDSPQVVTANQRFCDLVGWSLEEISGLSYQALLAPDDRPCYQDQIHQLEQGKINSFRLEACHYPIQGEPFWGAVTVAALNPMPNYPLLKVLFLEDISDRKRAELEVQKAKEEAESADRAKGLFIASMSHELRSPLNAILGFAHLLQTDKTLSQSHRDHVAIIEDSGQHLLHVINQILSFAKLEGRSIPLELETVNFGDFIDHLQKLFYIKAQEKNLRFEVIYPATLRIDVRIDTVKLRQVLINLVDNAIKFTDQGQVTLTVTGDRPPGSDPDGPLHLHFCVEDTGLGISPEEQSLLFKPFSQTGAGQRYQGGTGLGLAISQRFIQRMGGEIAVTSQVGQGACFSFTLEVTQPAVPGEGVPLVPQGKVMGLEPGCPPYRVLVVDDGVVNRRLLMHLLSVLGLEIQEAREGSEAIALWQSWQPQVVWMDVQMPGIDGFEATRQIRALEAQNLAAQNLEAQNLEAQNPAAQNASPLALPGGTCIIAMSATDFSQQPQILWDQGFTDYITKPFVPTEIFQVLQRHLPLRYRYASTA